MTRQNGKNEPQPIATLAASTCETIVDTANSSPDPPIEECADCGLDRSYCGRHVPPGEVDHIWLCNRCYDRRLRYAKWATTDENELAELCGRLGIQRTFVRNGTAPSLEDPGLAERIEKNPLPTGGLYVTGAIGTHKTHLLCARAVDAAKRGYTAYVLNWTRFTLEIRATYQPGAANTELDLLDHYAAFDLLCIDDMGIGRGTSPESEAALRLGYLLLDSRYGSKQTTDVASNLTPRELETRFDERIARRIAEITTPYAMIRRK